jgi:hypothetical protein
MSGCLGYVRQTLLHCISLCADCLARFRLSGIPIVANSVQLEQFQPGSPLTTPIYIKRVTNPQSKFQIIPFSLPSSRQPNNRYYLPDAR